jgi:CubicO group peptidase (beta-lactamase class C family)
MDSELLAELFAAIQKDGLRMHSLLIVRHGYLVTEAYWEPYGPKDVHTIQSLTKTVIGSLIGIAVERGEIQGVDQPVVDLFPDRTIKKLDDQKRLITLRHLLTMTPGLTCQDQSSAAQGMYASKDWAGYLLDLPVSDPPGQRWIYCSGASHLASAILQGATGSDARTYVNDRLFAPLGIPEVSAQDWAADPSGVSNGVAGLYLAPRDLAKYGYLYLRGGMWDGRQVVPAQWVDESVRGQVPTEAGDFTAGQKRDWGYFWSVFPEQGYYGYLGMAGQELWVVPEKDLVVVFTGALDVGKEAALLPLLNDYIIPAVHSENALSANPQAEARLAALIQAAAGAAQPVPELPPLALDISGKTYQLDPNPLGWTDMTYVFTPGSATATLKMTASPDLLIGLDNRYRLNAIPGGRPVGLRGRWATATRFELDYIIKGDFVTSLGSIEFPADRITVSVKLLNSNTPPLLLQGRLIEK